MEYVINKNKDFNSFEITFNEKPSETIRNILKSLGFRWHGVKKVWYGYKDEQTIKNALDNNITKEVHKPVKVEKLNKFGIKVGDVFSASWGYEQTNVDFFQVVALVGECSVRVKEVRLPMISDDAVSSMSADRTYQLTTEMLPTVLHPSFIEDNEKGDLKRIQAGWGKTPEEEKENCYFKLSSFANAHKCNGDKIKVYESWYY